MIAERIWDWQSQNVLHVNEAPETGGLLEIIADEHAGPAVTLLLEPAQVRKLRLALQRWERSHA